MKGPGRSLAWLLLIASAATLVALAVLPEGAEAQIPKIVVNLEPRFEEQTAFPTETANDILEFEGCLTLNRPIWPPGPSVVIEITMEMSGVDPPWSYSIDPPTHTFTASESQSFNASVTVPAGLPATVTIGYALEFTASTDNIILYDVESDTARVNIAQYYRMTRFFSTEPIRVEQGEVIDFNFTLVNGGNGADTFSFEITNQAEMLFAGLTVVEITPKMLEIDEEVDVKVTMQAATDAKEGQFKLNLTITSQGSVGDANYEQPVTSGIEWNVIVEPSLTQTIWDNLSYIVLVLVVVVVVAVVLVHLRRRRRAVEEEEGRDEDTPRPKGKPKKRTPGKAEEEEADDG